MHASNISNLFLTKYFSKNSQEEITRYLLINMGNLYFKNSIKICMKLKSKREKFSYISYICYSYKKRT